MNNYRIKFLLFSDIHDDEEALARLILTSKKEKVDAVLCCGDITGNSRWFAEKTCTSFEAPFFFVPGNNEEPEILLELDKYEGNLHGKEKTFTSILLTGFGFSNLTPYHTPNELTEADLAKQLNSLKVDSSTVFLGHCPPFGFFDIAHGKHAGSAAVRAFIETKQPLAYLCGHVHAESGISKIGQTTIIKIPAACLYKYAILEIENGKCSVRFKTL